MSNRIVLAAFWCVLPAITPQHSRAEEFNVTIDVPFSARDVYPDFWVAHGTWERQIVAENPTLVPTPSQDASGAIHIPIGFPAPLSINYFIRYVNDLAEPVAFRTNLYGLFQSLDGTSLLDNSEHSDQGTFTFHWTIAAVQTFALAPGETQTTPFFTEALISTFGPLLPGVGPWPPHDLLPGEAARLSWQVAAFPLPPEVALALTLPGALNLRSLGHWVTACLQPPPELDAGTIDISSIQFHGNVPASAPVSPDPLAPAMIGDENGDQIPDLTVKFDRAALELTLSEGAEVPVDVTGSIAGQPFRAMTTLKVLRAPITAPTAGTVLSPGAPTTVCWEIPKGVAARYVALLFSMDDGATWALAASNMPNVGSCLWTIPNQTAERARVAVVLVESEEPGGSLVNGVLGVSDAFAIQGSLAVGDNPHSECSLSPPLPNPMRGPMHLHFKLGSSQAARIEVVDITGRRVAKREVGMLGPGPHELVLRDGLRPGIYMVRLIQGDESRVVRGTVIE